MNKKNIFLISSILVVMFILFVSFSLKKGDLFKTTKQRKETEDLINIGNNLNKDNKNVLEMAKKNQNNIIPVKYIDKNDNFTGNLKAPVQLIVYSDFTCPFCADYYNTLKTIKNEFKDNLVIAFRYYTIENHDNSLELAELAECAAEQNKFWEMHDLIFENNKKTIDELINLSKNIAINSEKIKICLTKEKYKDKILLQKEEAKSFGVIGTPTTFLNQTQLEGSYRLDDFTDPNGNKFEGLRTLINKEIQKEINSR